MPEGSTVPRSVPRYCATADPTSPDCEEPAPPAEVDADVPTSELDEPVAEVEKYFCGADSVVDSAAT